MLGNDLIEDGATGVSRLIDGRYHNRTFRQQLLLGSLARPKLYICALYPIALPLASQKMSIRMVSTWHS
jgi:hypothetical protein